MRDAASVGAAQNAQAYARDGSGLPGFAGTLTQGLGGGNGELRASAGRGGAAARLPIGRPSTQLLGGGRGGHAAGVSRRREQRLRRCYPLQTVILRSQRRRRICFWASIAGRSQRSEQQGCEPPQPGKYSLAPRPTKPTMWAARTGSKGAGHLSLTVILSEAKDLYDVL